jgi:hypothetical protein
MQHLPMRPLIQAHLKAAMLLLVLAMTCLVGAADQAPLVLVHPAGTSLALAASSTKTPSAQFTGTVVLHAFLVARWLPSDPEGRRLKAHFHLLPTPESAQSLPHYQGHPLTHLTVPQGLKLLAQATSPDIAREFASRRQPVVHAEGLFSLRRLRVDAVCLSRASAQVDHVDPIGFTFQDPGSPDSPGSPGSASVQCAKP